MPKVLSVAVVGTVASICVGCTTLSVEERTAACAGTDWYRFGVNDGTLGVPTTERADKFADCAELGHPADLAAYQTGRAEGLQSYCTVENGYEVGYEGRRYRQVCPPDLEPDFLQGYAQGRDDRPSYALYPRLGIGIGSGGVRTGVGVGIGLFSGYGRYPCGYWGHRHCW